MDFCPEIVDAPRPLKRTRVEEAFVYNELILWQQFEIESLGNTSIVCNLNEVAKDVVLDDESSTDESSVEEDWKIFVSQPEISCIEFYSKFVKKTLEECIDEMKAPQRSETWLNARKQSITASQFGAAVGHSPQTSQRQVAIEKIWSTFVGNAATMQGTLHEPNASLTFENFFRTKMQGSYDSFEMREQGLLKSPKCPWIAVSPDGILQVTKNNITEWFVLEYKCPYQRNQGYEHPQKKWDHSVPPQQLDQVQGILGQCDDTQVHRMQDQSISRAAFPNLKESPTGSFFVVWTPNQTQITFVPYLKTYFQNEMIPALKNFQFHILLPAMTHFFNGKLQTNSLDARETIYASL